MSTTAILAPEFDATRPKRDWALGSIRVIKYFLLWLAVWQDNTLEEAPLQLYTYIGRFHSIRTLEIVLIALVIVLLIERTLLGDFTLRRSYFTGPLLLLGAALFISWSRGEYLNQNVHFAYEMHEAPEIIIDFYLLLNLFRDREEARNIMLILLFGTIAKSLDGLTIYFFSNDPQKSWGALYISRDGYLVALGIATIFLFYHYHGTSLRWARKIFLWCAPIIFFTLIVSFRRSFMIAAFCSVFMMFFTLPKGRRASHAKLGLSALFIFIVIILATDPIGFVLRIAGIFDGSEGSAYIRVMEYPNVIQNILHNPIWGTAIDTQWHQYYRMPTYANYTTLGTHNSYLYWQLRTGLLGTIGIIWLFARAWKFALLYFRIAKTEEDLFFGQIAIYSLVIFMVGCAFGIMFADAVTCLLAIILLTFQLLIRHYIGDQDFRQIRFRDSWRSRELVFNP